MDIKFYHGDLIKDCIGKILCFCVISWQRFCKNWISLFQKVCDDFAPYFLRQTNSKWKPIQMDCKEEQLLCLSVIGGALWFAIKKKNQVSVFLCLI